MNKLIARLIDCGMSREVALFMYGKYKREGKLDDFERYVESVDGRDQEAVLPVLDELMSTLQVIQPRLYNAVMDKLF